MIHFFAFLLSLSASLAWSQDQASAPRLEDIRSGFGSICSSKTDYFVKEVRNLLQYSSLSAKITRYQPFRKAFVRRSCINSSQAQVTAGRDLTKKDMRKGGRKAAFENNFVRCDYSTKKLQEHLETPCWDRDSQRLVHNSFELVTQCLVDYVAETSDPNSQREWIRTFFKMITKESGFQNNVKSGSPAFGITQLTAPYVKDFLLYTLDEVRDHLKKSSQSECRQLGEEVLSEKSMAFLAQRAGPYKELKLNRCALIGADNNQVLTNLVIGFSNLRVSRERTRKFLKSQGSKISMSESEIREAEHFLIPWLYNGGSGNLEKWIESGVESRSTRRPISSSDELFKTVLPAITKEEARNYLPTIEERYKDVVRASGFKDCWAQ